MSFRSQTLMSQEEFLKATKKAFPSTIKAFYTKGSFGMVCVTLTSQKEAKKLAGLYEKASNKPSQIEEVYNEKDVFDDKGELVDVIRLDLKGYNVINVFKES